MQLCTSNISAKEAEVCISMRSCV